MHVFSVFLVIYRNKLVESVGSMTNLRRPYDAAMKTRRHSCLSGGISLVWQTRELFVSHQVMRDSEDLRAFR